MLSHTNHHNKHDIKLSKQKSRFFDADQKDVNYDTVKLIAGHILNNDIDKALSMLKKPAYLYCSVIAEDTNKRAVKGKLIEIAAMAGVSDENIEKIASAGKLSREEIDKQLEVIKSTHAIEENERRNTVAINALKILAKEISEIKDDPKNKNQYLSAIKRFINTLHYKCIITSGYIFDRQIMIDAIDFFQRSPLLQKFSDRQIEILEEYGIKQIKSMLCAADQPPFYVMTMSDLDEFFKPSVEKVNTTCCITM